MATTPVKVSKTTNPTKENNNSNNSNNSKIQNKLNLNKQNKQQILPKIPKISKMNLFKKLGDFDEITKTTRFVNKDEFVNEYSSLFFKNGGDWCRNSTIKTSIYKFATMKSNGTEINIPWKASDEEAKIIEEDFRTNCKIIKGNNQVYYFKIFGIKNEDSSHPIRKDILDYYKKIPCVNCGSNSELQCDHKNGLYNDLRVLDAKTQTLEDFQSLCRHCNCQKRQVEKKTKETSKRYSASNIPSLNIFCIDFIEGDETINFEDINALKGTYWYDPIEFMKQIKLILGKSKK